VHHDWLTATPRKERRTALFPRQQLAQVVQHKHVRLARASARARHALPSEQHWLPLFFNVRATQLHVTAMGVVRHQGKAPHDPFQHNTKAVGRRRWHPCCARRSDDSQNPACCGDRLRGCWTATEQLRIDWKFFASSRPPRGRQVRQGEGTQCSRNNDVCCHSSPRYRCLYRSLLTPWCVLGCAQLSQPTRRTLRCARPPIDPAHRPCCCRSIRDCEPWKRRCSTADSAAKPRPSAELTASTKKFLWRDSVRRCHSIPT